MRIGSLALPSFSSVVAAVAIATCNWFAAPATFGQIPVALQEQVETFASLPPAVQQTLIRELQRSLPPGQRDVILSQLMRQDERSLNTTSGDENAFELDQGTVDASRLLDFTLPEAAPRLGAASTIILRFELIDTVPAPAQAGLEAIRERLENANPYHLDENGVLYLPGVPSIRLAGLDEEQATIRIEAEPAIRGLDVTLTYLPLEPVGAEALKPFGYELFSGLESRFRSSPTTPVPANYVVGPGDTVNIQLFGSQNQEFFLPVSREGQINFPQIGPITVSGLTVEQLRNTVSARVAEQMIGVRASTTLGELRSVEVAVLGEVQRPGSYSVGGMSTITSALYASGGVKPIGSLRNIALLRGGETIALLDIYDLLLNGSTEDDVRIADGDVVFVPTIGSTVTIDGAVRRPAVYELGVESSLADVVQLAGGFTPNANRGRIKLDRVIPGRGRTIQDIEFSTTGMAVAIRDGDFIFVDRNLERFEGSIRLAGNVVRPGLYEWNEGMTLKDLLPSPEQLKPMSDVNYVLIRRENEPHIDIEVLSADLDAIWRNTVGAWNPELRPNDSVTVFNVEVGRSHIIEPLMAELRARTPSGEAARRVSVGGTVHAEGQYPLERAMRVSDLVRAGGGLRPSAYLQEAELARYEVVGGDYRETALLSIDLAAALRGETEANILLQPYDHLTVKEVPRWREQQTVELVGEVHFPGKYSIRQGERLSSVLERAGGLTDLAFPRGSVFTRVELREREAERLESLARRIEMDLAADALSDTMSGEIANTGQALIAQLRSTDAVGRLVIDLDAIVAGRDASDIVLRNGDQLFIPPVTQEVMVLGEVQYATSHLYADGLTRDDYIDMSGGVTSRADRRRVYVVRANGAVVAEQGGKWFNRRRATDIEPGDTVIVPLHTDRVRPLTAAESITQILYNIAVAFSVIDRI